MKRSTDRIRVTHTGSLPRPQEIFDMMKARAEGKVVDDKLFEEKLTRGVAEVVRMQKERGIDVVSDGECSKPSFLGFIGERLSGYEARIPPEIGRAHV